MKRYILICLLMIGAVYNVIAGPRRCTEQDIPMDMRSTYIQQARQMIEAYYTQLPLCIGEPMVKEAFIANFMQDGKSAYKPEFLPTARYDAMLEPQQYLQELDKLALKWGEDELSFDIQKFSVNPKDFFAPSMVSCYLRANYQLVIKLNDSKLATRECEAYCLFPQAAVSINVKLMQVDVTKGEDYKVGQEQEATDKTTVVPISTPVPSSKDEKVDTQSVYDTTKENKAGFFYGLFHPDKKMKNSFYILIGLAVAWFIIQGIIGNLKFPWVWYSGIGGALFLYFLYSLIYYYNVIGVLCIFFLAIIWGTSFGIAIEEKYWKKKYGKWSWSSTAASLLISVVSCILSILFILYLLI